MVLPGRLAEIRGLAGAAAAAAAAASGVLEVVEERHHLREWGPRREGKVAVWTQEETETETGRGVETLFG